MIRIAICDDDLLICSQLKEYLKAVSTNRNIKMSTDIYNSGEEFYSSVEKGLKYDIVFLDIELGDSKGTEIACDIRNTLGNPFTKIIFISSSNEYGPEVVDSSPVKYLVKPLNFDMVEEAYKIAKQAIDEDRKIFIYNDGTTKKSLLYREIYYFEASDKKVKIVTKKGDVFFYGKISEIVEQDISGFISIHRSYVINYFMLKDWSPVEVVMENDDKLPISKAKKEQVEEEIMNYVESYATYC